MQLLWGPVAGPGSSDLDSLSLSSMQTQRKSSPPSSQSQGTRPLRRYYCLLALAGEQANQVNGART